MESGSTGRRDTTHRDRFPLHRGDLRKGLHGWWLGNPLMICPSGVTAVAHALRLAREGAAEGTCVAGAETVMRDAATDVEVELALIMPLAVPDPLVQRAAAIALWETLTDAGVAGDFHPVALLSGTSPAGTVSIEHEERWRLLLMRIYLPEGSAPPERIIAATLRRLNLTYMTLSGSGPDAVAE